MAVLVPYVYAPEQGPDMWERKAALRCDFSRRLALIEIDVIVAISLGLSLSDLKEIYRVYFPVLDSNERGTWYDSNGQIVWTNNGGLGNTGWRILGGKKPSREMWEKTLDEMNKHPNEEQVLRCKVIDDTHPEGPREVERVFYGPFSLCDRMKDYERAWKHFEKHKGITS